MATGQIPPLLHYDFFFSEKVENSLIRFNPDSTEGMEYELDDNTYLIRDRFSDIGALSDLFDALSELDTGDGDVTCSFFGIKDTPTYPSADNILNQILLCPDLDYDDFLIVYYSGHVGSENGFTMLDAESILLPFVKDGSITEGQKEAVLDSMSSPTVPWWTGLPPSMSIPTPSST